MRGSATFEKPVERLIRAATYLIANFGMFAADPRAIVKQAGTSTSRFYEFFGSVDDIREAVFSRGWDLLIRALSENVTFAFLSGDAGEVVIAAAESAIECFIAHPEPISATVILGLETIGQPLRQRLKSTPAFQWYAKTSHRIEVLAAKSMKNSADAREAANLLFGGVVRRLALLTPLYRKETELEFDQEAFMRVFRKMVRSMFSEDVMVK